VPDFVGSPLCHALSKSHRFRVAVLLLLAYVLGPRTAAAGTLYTTFVDDLAGGPTWIASINPGTGVVTPIGPPHPDVYVEALAYDSRNDVLYAATNQRGRPSNVGPYDLSRIDRQTGALTVVGSMGYNIVPGLAYDSRNDRLFAVTRGSGYPTLITVDRATGAGTLAPGSDVSGGSSLEYLPRTDRLLISDFSGRLTTFSEYDLQSRTEYGVLGYFEGGIFGTGYDPDTGKIYALAGGQYLKPGNTLYTVDLTGGTLLTPAATLSRTAFYSSMAVVAVPEPGLAAWPAGAGAFLLARRVRRGARAARRVC
jgi:hypothetical protein